MIRSCKTSETAKSSLVNPITLAEVVVAVGVVEDVEVAEAEIETTATSETIVIGVIDVTEVCLHHWLTSFELSTEQRHQHTDIAR